MRTFRKLENAVAFVLAGLIIVDGDTINLDGERIRLMGFDAPETYRAQCPSERERGLAAKRRLSELLNGHTLNVRRCCLDKYGRTLAHVLVDGRDVGETMVGEGLARVYKGGHRKGWCER